MKPAEFFLEVYGIGMDTERLTNEGVWEFIFKVENLIKRWREDTDDNA